MKRLDTVSDFEKAVEALKSRILSKLEYCIATYGFCGQCRKITEYEIATWELDEAGPAGALCIFCFNCNTKQIPYDPHLKRGCYIVRAELLTKPARDEIRRLHSRKHQRRLLAEKIDQKIRDLVEIKAKIH